MQKQYNYLHSPRQSIPRGAPAQQSTRMSMVKCRCRCRPVFTHVDPRASQTESSESIRNGRVPSCRPRLPDLVRATETCGCVVRSCPGSSVCFCLAARNSYGWPVRPRMFHIEARSYRLCVADPSKQHHLTGQLQSSACSHRFWQGSTLALF